MYHYFPSNLGALGQLLDRSAAHQQLDTRARGRAVPLFVCTKSHPDENLLAVPVYASAWAESSLTTTLCPLAPTPADHIIMDTRCCWSCLVCGLLSVSSLPPASLFLFMITALGHIFDTSGPLVAVRPLCPSFVCDVSITGHRSKEKIVGEERKSRQCRRRRLYCCCCRRGRHYDKCD